VRTLDLTTDLLTLCASLLQAVKDDVDELSVEKARHVYSTVLEAEGYLLSVRKALVPPGTFR
jgi:hypothetical protein